MIPAWWEGGELLALDTTTASLALLTHHTKWGSRDTFGLYCHDLGWKGREGGLLLEVPDVAIALQGGSRSKERRGQN